MVYFPANFKLKCYYISYKMILVLGTFPMRELYGYLSRASRVRSEGEGRLCP